MLPITASNPFKPAVASLAQFAAELRCTVTTFRPALFEVLPIGVQR
jgi:hypothetical protein